MTETLRAGVIGVGSMGRNHARVYRELAGVELTGVADLDDHAAERVAVEYGTTAYETPDLLREVDLVSVAVPTQAHAPVVEQCIAAGVHALVEKPFVTDVDVGRDLAERAAEENVVLQVGHVERFNPAVRTLAKVAADLDVIAVDALRLGPPVDREIGSNVVYDLMIHDLDVVRSMLGEPPASVSAFMTADGEYATANCEFGDDTLATFTASRVTQQKVRRLGITARECRVLVDYIDQSVEIHRAAAPAYVEEGGDLRHTTESVIERPLVESGEPLKIELGAFADAVRDGTSPLVTAEDGLRAVELAHCVVAAADADPERVVR